MSRAREFADLAGPADAGGITGRNLVINGSMQVNQRNADATGTNYNTDRFKQEKDGGTCTFSWETLSSGSPYDEGFRRFSRMTNTATASGAGNYRQFRHAIEAQNVATSGWDYTNPNSFITVSFWVRSSVGGKYTFTFQTEDGTDKLYNFSRTLVANTWTKVTETVPGHADLQFDNDSGNGLMLHFRIWLGSNYTSATSEDAWVTYAASTISESGIANWAGTTNSTYDITGVQIEVGEKATPFEHLSFGDELARCQRYYEKSYAYSVGAGTAASYPGNIGLTVRGMDEETSGQRYITQTMRVEKRGSPTNTFYDDAGNSGKVTTFDSGGTPTNNVSIGLVVAQNSMIGCGPGNSAIWGFAFFYESDAEL